MVFANDAIGGNYLAVENLRLLKSKARICAQWCASCNLKQVVQGLPDFEKGGFYK